MVNTLPLTLIAIRALNTVFATRILRKINESMLIILLQTGTIGTIVKVACYQHLCIWRQGKDRVNRCADSIGHHPAERSAILLATKPTGLMNHKHM